MLTKASLALAGFLLGGILTECSGNHLSPTECKQLGMLNYLTETLSIIEASYFGSGIILGDFNQLNVRRLNTNFNLKQIDVCDVTLSVYPHRASLKNIPGHGGNRTYDLWNTSPMLCQLSYAVRSVRVSDISEQNLVPSIPM